MKARLALALGLGAALLVAATSEEGPRAASAEVRGVGLGLFASDPGYDYGDLVGEIADRGATDVIVVVQWAQSTIWSHDVGPGERTATDAVIRRTIAQAHESGMRVTLMPIVRLRERTATQWRGNIQPDPQRWFEAYRAQLLPLARLADEARVARLVVGSELSSLQRHDAAWRSLIADVRAVYPGRLSYSANWDAFAEVGFWDALDDVGVTAYFPLSRAEAPSDDELAQAWEGPRRALAELRARTGRPVIVTEIGYPSHERAAQTPWDQTAGNTARPRLQADLYRAFCDAYHQPAAMADGFFVWNWFGFGGPREISYTPRGKPAAAELERCLRREHGGAR